MNHNALEKEVTDIAEEWRTAFERADIATLDRLLCDSYTLTTVFGVILTKAQTLDLIRSGGFKIFSMQINAMSVRLYGDAAVVTGMDTMKAKQGNTEISGQFRFTDVMVRKRGYWAVVAVHSSTIAPPPAGSPADVATAT